jgi:pyridoxine 4-dehydrogenase
VRDHCLSQPRSLFDLISTTSAGFTWRPEPTPVEDAIKVMKRALELGSNYWNGGEFYGPPEYNSLHLLKAYFEKYPEDADKVVINIKGGMALPQMRPDGTEAGVRRSVDACNAILGGVKKIDIFESARVDPTTPIEETMGHYKKLIDEGKISAVALSEVRAETIRKAAKVQHIGGGVEIEFSLFAPEPLTNGIFEACAEHGIPVIAYSPLGRGFLVGLYNFDKDIY